MGGGGVVLTPSPGRDLGNGGLYPNKISAGTTMSQERRNQSCGGRGTFADDLTAVDRPTRAVGEGRGWGGPWAGVERGAGRARTKGVRKQRSGPQEDPFRPRSGRPPPRPDPVRTLGDRSSGETRVPSADVGVPTTLLVPNGYSDHESPRRRDKQGGGRWKGKPHHRPSGGVHVNASGKSRRT